MRALFIMIVVAAPLVAQPPERWRLVEEWRVGGEVDGPHSFGDVRGMAVMANGRIALIEFKDQQVHIFDAMGQPLRSVGRRGAGPGEFQQANGLAVSPSGQIVVNDPSNNRLTLFAANGDFVRTVPILQRWGYGYMWEAYFNRRGLLEERILVRKEGERTSVSAVRTWSADYATTDTVASAMCVPPPANPGERYYEFRSERARMMLNVPFLAPRTTSVQGPDGATWSSRHPDYRAIELRGAGRCEPDAKIELRPPRVRIPTTVRDSAVDLVKTSAARYGSTPPDVDRIPREYPFYDALHLDAAGRLWVERQVEAKKPRFEVFSSRGVLLAEVESPVLFRTYRPFLIASDRVLGFIADEDDVVYLASYRIVR
jgi:hypothetical protein